MDEVDAIIIVSLYGFFTTLLFVFVVLACRIDSSDYVSIEEN
jgi:hypothetical protein